MTPDFDPYYKWLGIPPAEQPPTHYRLLGIRPEEMDAEVISNAADRMMRQLRKYQTGARAKLSQHMLREIVQAKNCLLDPNKRTAYDLHLKQSRGRSRTGSRQAPPRRSPNRKGRADKPIQPKHAVQRPIIIASLVGLAAGLLIAVLVFFVSRPSPHATAQKSANESPQSEPVEIPAIGSGRTMTVQPDPTPSVRNKRLGRSTGEKEEQESSTQDSEEQEKANDSSSAETGKPTVEDEKPSSDPEEAMPPVKKEPLRFVALEVLPNDAKGKLQYGEREGFYVVTAQSRAIPYRLDIKAPAGPFIGLCLEAHGAEYESATLSGVELSSSKVTWSSALDSAGQGSAAALVEDQTEWPMTYNGKDPIWAVFAAEKPFGKPGPHRLKIELDHSDSSQRLPRFRLWGITGSGTVEEMAQAMRERKLAEKPFAEFIAHGLPEGGTGEVSLGKVFVGAEQLSAQLFGGSSDDGDLRFRLNETPSDDAEAVQRWEFLQVADDQSTPVAELMLQGEQGERQADLTLRWLPIAAELPRAAGLQNGLLQLQIGPYSRSVPLREVRKQVALSYSPKKTVRPRIEAPAGMPAAELRLALQFPATTFGTVSTVVLPIGGGEEAETEVTIKDDLLLTLATSWKSPEITLTVKTFLPVKEVPKKKSDSPKTKLMLFNGALKEIHKLKKRYEDSKPVIAFIEKMEKFAGRTYPRKPEDKRDWMRISKQWYGLGLPPPKRIDPEVAKQLLGNAQAAQAAIKKDLDTLEGLQEWSKTFGQDGIAAIEFRVYTLIDGVPLELIRSTGWQD